METQTTTKTNKNNNKPKNNKALFYTFFIIFLIFLAFFLILITKHYNLDTYFKDLIKEEENTDQNNKINNQNNNPNNKEEPINQQFCNTNSDCACGKNIHTNECFIGNSEFIDTTNPCPDFCKGIKGNLIIECENNKCVQKELMIDNPREKCANSGGSWRDFPTACVDSCDAIRNPDDIVCAQTITSSCDCGPFNCWNNVLQKCEEN